MKETVFKVVGSEALSADIPRRGSYQRLTLPEFKKKAESLKIKAWLFSNCFQGGYNCYKALIQFDRFAVGYAPNYVTFFKGENYFSIRNIKSVIFRQTVSVLETKTTFTFETEKGDFTMLAD